MGLFRATAGALRRSLARTRSALQGLGSVLRGRTLDAACIDEIESRLLQADVGLSATETLVNDLKRRVRQAAGVDAHEALQAGIVELLGQSSPLARCESGPTVILVAGVNGVGKTTSVAKIAHALRSEGRSVLLAAADTFRAGAVEQLKIWGERMGVDVISSTPGADPASVAFDAMDAAIARSADVLLVDTAGRMHNESGLMRELIKIRDVIAKRLPDAPHEVVLVLDATQGQNAVAQASAFSQAIDITGLFLAKLDGSARGGVVLAIAEAMQLPVKLVGTGERLEDVEAFEPEAFASALLADEH
ncbi:MAG: signal recognition particle-docking protein FtsY [Phycisphaerales bacterium]|nr:signal recognition particle-docking protein FtsY [Phycisphaerales bacterium]